ncbi:MAG: hypothetical protein MK106_15540 [Mariniblastus sp.]|nr:hypothetical protein [Mariniblastus sp.]
MCFVICRLFLTTSLLILSATAIPAQDEWDVLANSKELAFDDEQVEPLITLERTGGLRVAPPEGFAPQPLMALFADGTIVRGVDRPGVIEVRGKLSHRQLFELLDFVVNRQQFYNTDSEAIKTSLERHEPRVMISDALSSRFTVNLERGSHEVTVYALEFTQNHHPDIEALARLLAIEKRLQHHVAMIEIGETEKVQEILRAMNDELKKKRASLRPLTVEDIVYARRRAGQLTVNATKNIMHTNLKKRKTKVVGSYRQKGPDSEPTVGIYIMDEKE